MYMIGRLIILILLILTLPIIPQVHADLIVGEIGSIGVEPSAITAIDSDSDGVQDTAVIGTSSKAMAFGISAWSISVANVKGIAPVDFDKNGYMNGAIIAGGDVVAVDSSGEELWRAEKLLGKSAVAADLDGDGYKNEVVVGCWDRVAAFDSEGQSLWNYTDISEKNVMGITLTENSIIASAGKMLYFFKFNGNLRSGKAQSGTILAISPIDLEGDGTMNGVVTITKEGDTHVKINAYTMYGEDMGWSISLYHEASTDIVASPVDKYSKGRKEHVIINLESGAYWINSNGVVEKIGNVYRPSAIAPIDLDGDGILDDVLVSTKGIRNEGKLYVYNAYGQELAIYNKTGGVKIIAVDRTFDGEVNDAIVATSFDKRVYSVIADVSDSTTSTGTSTATTTTTTTTVPPQNTAAPGVTLPQVTAPSGSNGISVSLGPNQTVGEGSEVTLIASATPSTPGGMIVSYIWTEGNEILGQESTLKKVFDKGTHNVKIIIIDNAGAKAEGTGVITVTSAGTSDGGSAADSDSDGWTDAFELQMGTDPNNPDTDGDGIIDSKDPNPMVANDKGSPLDVGKALGPLLTVVKWVIIVGGMIIAVIYIREKVLDLLWERNKDSE